MTDYRPLTYVDSKLQVDSAIRDEDGIRIKTNYAKKTEIPTKVSDLQNDTGFITGLTFSELSSHPTTLQGYGITDAKIENGTITLGNNSITPLSASVLSDYVTLNTAQTIPGQKTFKQTIIIDNSAEKGYNIKRSGVTIGEWKRMRWDRIYDTDNNNALTGQLVNIVFNGGSEMRIVANNRTGQDAGAVLSVVQTDTVNYVSAPYRTYNSANTTDVVTIGMLDSLNLDESVKQVNATGNWNLPLVMGEHVNTTTTDYNGFVYHNQNIYANPSTGILTTPKINAMQIGGATKTYELQATGYKSILQLDKDTYWTTNGGQAHIEALLEYSKTNFGTTGTVNARKGIWLIKAKFSGDEEGVFIESVGDAPGTGDGTLRYLRFFVPKTTSYGPQIAVALDNANVKVYIRVTILTATNNWVIPATIGGDPGTTNYNQYTAEVGRYNYQWSNLKMATNITGSCDGRAGNTWDTILNDRFKYGEAVVTGSLVAMGSDGLAWKLRNTAKEFRLPLVGGRAGGTFAVNQSYGALNWSIRGIALTDLTNADIQGTAFTVPTWAVGNTIYMRGSLSNGNFKPDGTLSNTMANGYTWIAIGKVEKINSDAVTQCSYFMMNCSAYTLDSNGKLTHIDGKQIYDSGNTDTKVRQTLQTGNYNLPLLMSYVQTSDTTSNRDGVSYRNNSIYANPSTGTITATGFAGNLTGNVTGNCSGSAGSVAWGNVSDKPAIVSQVKVGSTTFTPTSGVVTLPAYPSIVDFTPLSYNPTNGTAFYLIIGKLLIHYGQIQMNDSTTTPIAFYKTNAYKNTDFIVTTGQWGTSGSDQFRNGFAVDVKNRSYISIRNNTNANNYCMWMAIGEAT